MAKVTLKNMLPMHLRAARALLNMSAREFADYAEGRITPHTIRSFENGRGTSPKTLAAFIVAIEKAGLQLMNGGKPGVRIVDAEAFDKVCAGDSGLKSQ